MGTVGATRTVVLRQTGAVLVPVAVWVVCALALGDAVVEGTPGFAVRVFVHGNASDRFPFAVGVLSALINLPIVEAPVARPVAQPA